MQRGTGSALKGAGHGLTQLPTLSSSRQAGVHAPPDTRRQHPGTRGGEPLSPLPSLLPPSSSSSQPQVPLAHRGPSRQLLTYPARLGPAPRLWRVGRYPVTSVCRLCPRGEMFCEMRVPWSETSAHAEGPRPPPGPLRPRRPCSLPPSGRAVPTPRAAQVLPSFRFSNLLWSRSSRSCLSSGVSASASPPWGSVPAPGVGPRPAGRSPRGQGVPLLTQRILPEHKGRN